MYWRFRSFWQTFKRDHAIISDVLSAITILTAIGLVIPPIGAFMIFWFRLWF